MMLDEVYLYITKKHRWSKAIELMIDLITEAKK